MQSQFSYIRLSFKKGGQADVCVQQLFIYLFIYLFVYLFICSFICSWFQFVHFPDFYFMFYSIEFSDMLIVVDVRYKILDFWFSHLLLHALFVVCLF